MRATRSWSKSQGERRTSSLAERGEPQILRLRARPTKGRKSKGAGAPLRMTVLDKESASVGVLRLRSASPHSAQDDSTRRASRSG